MTKSERSRRVSQLAKYPLLATLPALLSLVLFNGNVIAQGLSLTLNDGVVPSSDTVTRAITVLDDDISAYDRRQVEPLGDLGRLSLTQGEFHQALAFFKQALHVVRINRGLYDASQIPIVDDIIATEIALRNWESVDNYYSYQAHLYKRLYAMDDPRLEAGLKKVSAWHVTALNVNLDGRRLEHLRKANELFKLRMRIAENTLAVDDPKFAVLAQNIEICERELFRASDLSHEIVNRKQRDERHRRKAYRESERRLIVTAD